MVLGLLWLISAQLLHSFDTASAGPVHFAASLFYAGLLLLPTASRGGVSGALVALGLWGNVALFAAVVGIPVIAMATPGVSGVEGFLMRESDRIVELGVIPLAALSVLVSWGRTFGAMGVIGVTVLSGLFYMAVVSSL